MYLKVILSVKKWFVVFDFSIFFFNLGDFFFLASRSSDVGVRLCLQTKDGMEKT